MKNFKIKKFCKYEIFNKQVIILVLFILFIISVFNYLINPYNIFKQRFLPDTFLKADAKIQERLTKPIGLKFDKRKIDTIFIGSSRVDLCIDKNDYKSLTNKNAENIAVGGVFPSEIIEMIDITKKIHPEIKNVFVGIDFEYFTGAEQEDDNRIKITNNPKLSTSEFCTSLLSINTTGTSFWTIFKNLFLSKQRTYYSSGVKFVFVNDNISQEFQNTVTEYTSKYEKYYVDEEKINSLVLYLKQLEKDNKNVKLFIMPTHVTLQKLLYNSNQTQNYNYVKEELSRYFEIYDFNYPNEYTKETVKPDMKYFFDGSHATHYLSKIIISDLLSDKPNLARKITKNNVKQINNLFVQDIKNYEDLNNVI